MIFTVQENKWAEKVLDNQDDDEPGVLTWAVAAFSIASIGVMLFQVATDSSRPAPLLDLAASIVVMIAGIVVIILLFGTMAGKEIDDDEAIDDPSWILRAKYALAIIGGMATVFGGLYVYRIWLTG